jgi:peptidyl-prolyl cis-trans isomerase SurA
MQPKKQTVASNASDPPDMRNVTLSHMIAFSLASLILAGAVSPRPAAAQNIVVLVNDEPITSFDIEQRKRWIALTGGSFGEHMKALLTGDAVNQKFRQMMIAAQPHSQAEAQQAAERIKKQLIENARQQVLSSGGGTSRQALIDALIEDKLKLQAAKKHEIKITDKEVEESVAARAAANPNLPPGQKPDLNAVYQQYEGNGINRKTMQEIIRAQLAWRDVIRKKFGQRIFAVTESSPGEANASSGDMHFDVRVLRLAVQNGADQRAVGERMLEAESFKEKFHSCAELQKEAKLVAGATVKTIDKAKLSSFPKDVQPLIEKVSEGQMTPPVLVGNAVESYALCRKGAVVKAEHKPDARQAEFDRFSRSYMQELKQSASIDYRGS